MGNVIMKNGLILHCDSGNPTFLTDGERIDKKCYNFASGNRNMMIATQKLLAKIMELERNKKTN